MLDIYSVDVDAMELAYRLDELRRRLKWQLDARTRWEQIEPVTSSIRKPGFSRNRQDVW